jgi:hypothetical protein
MLPGATVFGISTPAIFDRKKTRPGQDLPENESVKSL